MYLRSRCSDEFPFFFIHHRAAVFSRRENNSKQSRGDAINAMSRISGVEKRCLTFLSLCTNACIDTSLYATFNAKLMSTPVNYHLTFRYLFIASRFVFRSRLNFYTRNRELHDLPRSFARSPFFSFFPAIVWWFCRIHFVVRFWLK